MGQDVLRMEREYDNDLSSAETNSVVKQAGTKRPHSD